MASYTIWLSSSKEMKKAARFADDHLIFSASPWVPVEYHCLSETISLSWEGFEPPLPYSD